MTADDASLHLDVPSAPWALAVVRRSLRAFVENAPGVRLDEADLRETTVAVQEACTNVLKHAHGGRQEERFQVELRSLADGLEVRVLDHGEPFQLGELRIPDPDALEEGGYGLCIIHAWMDQVTVTREGPHNVLRMVRPYRPAEEKKEDDAHAAAV